MTNATPIAQSMEASSARTTRRPPSPRTRRPPVPRTVNSESEAETPAAIATAASTAAALPPSAAAFAATVAAVVAKNTHAPGFSTTATMPSAVGPSESPNPRVTFLAEARFASKSQELLDADPHEERASGDAQHVQECVAGLQR